MQNDQKQTHHGGTGQQETELGTVPEKKRPEDINGEADSSSLRNPSGDDILDAVDGDEGSGRTV
ncbi:MAG: hypothetical protein ABIR33_03615 [Pyrinomonadaceae bacterium]